MNEKQHKTTYIPSLRLDEDVVPLSMFRANVARFVEQVMATGRPMLLTQRGRGAVVLLDVREFEAMRECARAPGAGPQQEDRGDWMR